MRPLTGAALGLVLVLVDFRTRGADLCADPVGWALIGWCLWRLAGPRAALPAIAGAACSVASVWLPYHYRLVESYVVGPGGVARVVEVEVLEYDPVSGLRLAAMAGATSCLAVTVVGLVRLLRERAGTEPHDPVVGRMWLAALATVATWAVPRLVGMAAGAVDGSYDAVWNDPAWRVELVGILSGLALAVTFLVSRREPWALPPGERRLGNWSTLPPPGNR